MILSPPYSIIGVQFYRSVSEFTGLSKIKAGIFQEINDIQTEPGEATTGYSRTSYLNLML